MHKKLLVLFVALVLAAGMGFGQGASDSQTFTLTTTVQKYIECRAGLALTVTDPPIPGGGTAIHNGTYPAITFYTNDGNELAYANCPFTVQLSGDNGAGDNLPILARQEVGETRFDRLITSIGLQVPGTTVNISFYSDPDGAVSGTWNGNPSNCPVPHDGEVGAFIYLGAALPHLSPEFGVDNTWNESADAGTYTCTLTFTYAVI